jgi:hypothetical protein
MKRLFGSAGKIAMKLPRNRIHGIKAAIVLLALMSCGTAWGGVLDYFRSPAALILNQKNCTFMKQSYPGGIAGETLSGRFIFSPAAGVVVVMMSMERLDDNRVVARMERSENRDLLVLHVKKSKGAVTASVTYPQGAILFLECTLE